MIPLLIGTVILILTYGAFWHNQPARQPEDHGVEPVASNRRGLSWTAALDTRTSIQTKGGNE